jgi:hypothetical protein
MTVACGCTKHVRFEVDLARVKDFDWDGSVVLTKRYQGLFVGWQTDSVSIQGSHGRSVEIATGSVGGSKTWPTVRLLSDNDESERVMVTVRHLPSGVRVLLGSRYKRHDLQWLPSGADPVDAGQ